MCRSRVCSQALSYISRIYVEATLIWLGRLECEVLILHAGLYCTLPARSTLFSLCIVLIPAALLA